MAVGAVALGHGSRSPDPVAELAELALELAHVAKYQARIACDDIAGKPASAEYRAVPRVVFLELEIATVGLTEAQAREQGNRRDKRAGAAA